MSTNQDQNEEVENFTFRGQRDGESVLMVANCHPWALIKQAIIITLGLIIIIAMFIWFQVSAPAVWTSLILGPILLLYTLYSWYIWINNRYVLTSERVIVITCKSFFSRKVEDYGLDKIQSLAAEINGLAASVLGFGTVLIAIMGIKDQVRLQFIEDAYDFQNRIQDAIKQGQKGTAPKLSRRHV